MKQCPTCGSDAITLAVGGQIGKYECKSCGYIGPLILEETRQKQTNKPSLVILGAGFAGLAVAFTLRKKLGDQITITVVDKNSYNVFHPGLIEYVGGRLQREEITLDLPKRFLENNITFIQGKVMHLDRIKKQVYVAKASGNKPLHYDYLVIALGLETNTYGIQQLKEQTCFFKSLEDANRVRQTIKKITAAQHQLAIAIVGGGPTGVELAVSLRDYCITLFPYHRISFTIIHGSERLVKQLPLFVSKKIHSLLEKRKIKILLDTRVTKVSNHTLHFGDDQTMTADCILWVPGITLPKELEELPLESCANGIYVTPTLQTITDPCIFAVGDCATFKDEQLSQKTIKRAQTANYHGKLAADNIIAELFSKKKKTWKPSEIPTILTFNEDSMLHYKRWCFKSRFVLSLEHLIRFRHQWSYR
ncbi:FAD-dependent oxidoreductase [Candidatus Woesearchaeota archaeon]|nr:FAD-dependent oxidoreductase [Candidatus Woesearchaeota archaeon]